jgi:para-nitrobenzyl esterase
MKKSLFAVLFTVFIQFNSQAQCEDERYRYPIFSNVQVQSDVTYGQNAIYTGSTQELKLDVYQPQGDTETSRPLVIMAHGGYFLGGSKTDDTVVPICAGLSKMGYVTASISYRLGVPIQFPLAGPFTEAVMRGVQDMRAAIRFFRKSVAVNGNPYGINPDEIYVGGVSAGGFIALHLAYMDTEDVPANLNWGNPGLSGGVEGSSGNPGYSSEVKAIVSIAGALGNKQWIQAGETPAFLAHSNEDTVVPFGTEMLSLLGAFNVAVVDGSSSIHERLDDLGITNCFEVYYGQDHLPSQNIEQYFDTTLSIVSNFISHMMCPSIPLDCEYREMTLNTEYITEHESVLIYPNPATGFVYVNDNSAKVMRMTDITGKNMNVPHVGTGIDVSPLPAGIYLIEIEKSDKTIVQKLIVE